MSEISKKKLRFLFEVVTVIVAVLGVSASIVQYYGDKKISDRAEIVALIAEEKNSRERYDERQDCDVKELAFAVKDQTAQVSQLIGQMRIVLSKLNLLTGGN